VDDTVPTFVMCSYKPGEEGKAGKVLGCERVGHAMPCLLGQAGCRFVARLCCNCACYEATIQSVGVLSVSGQVCVRVCASNTACVELS
jgi:hypothetical protein